jgi:hypothetical protein
VPPINVLGGYRFPNAPAVDLALPRATAPAAPITFAGDDLSIPAFLRRDTDDEAIA